MARALFLVDNVPFELDSRVRRESQTLLDAGFDVVVICPGDRGQPRRENVEGVEVYRYRKPALGGGAAAHLVEYVVTLASQLALSAVAFARGGFDVVHIANPPDLLWLVALPYKALGRRLIFDQHDLVPELFDVRYGQRLPWLSAAVRACERASYRLSDHVIATNETCRRVALERGGLAADQVTVVRNGPRLSADFPPTDPDPGVRGLGDVVVGYLGIMNEQDHLELFLEMAAIIRFELKRHSIGFVMVGEGDASPSLRKLRRQLGLDEIVRMTGRIPWRDVLATMAATDICVQPDPPTSFNVKLTMNKLMEYMAFGKPAVAFDMPETRASGGDTVVYVGRYDAQGLADAVVDLADAPERRRDLGARARARVEQELAWEHQSGYLLRAYERVLGRPVSAGG